MKKTLLALMSCMVLTISAQTGLDQTAVQLAAKMAPGWNLGNTLEATNSANLYTNNAGLAAETSWQRTKTTQAVIDYVKSLGFRSVRIPCSWVAGHISDADNYTIDAAWMARVKEVVDYCINAGLYVVLNDHWDGGWLENNIAAGGATETKNKAVLEAIWKQIATEFRDYDEHLLFAGLNEPNAETQTATNYLKQYEQIFINTVRATGGNNAKRVLIIQGPATNIDNTCSYMTTLPTDTQEGKLMIEVHYYAPWQWWGMTADDSWGKMFYYWGAANHVSGSQHNATWGEESYMEAQLNKMKSQFHDKGVAVYIGEFGANWRTITAAGESQDKHNASIKHHYKTFMKKCFEKGMIPVVWDINSPREADSPARMSMGLIDRTNRSIFCSFMLDGIHEAMQEAGIPITGIIAVKNVTQQQHNGAVYDLKGRQIMAASKSSDAEVGAQLSKGIYIRNGKKFVVK